MTFSPRDAMNLLMMFDRINEKQLLETIEKNGGVSNFDILSQIMPPLSMKYKTNAFKDDKDDKATSNAIIEIRNGHYVRGQMDKSVLGSRTKGLLQRVCNDFGNMASAKFVDDLQNVVTEYMKSAAFSVGISDLISDKKTNDDIVKVITKKKTDVKNLIDQVQIGIFQNNTGKTNEEEFETQVNSILNQATSESGKIGLSNLSKDNRFVTMVKAGSKGSDLNISFMISCLGQQNVDGKRIPYGFEHRTLPHFTKYDDSPGARGFVESSYIDGLTPQELFFHAMGGRVGLIDTAVKTSTTGYIQRRLIKGLEDLMVSYDMTIRTNKNKIVQFSYGDDNIDTIKVEDQSIPIVSMSTQDIYAHYLIPEDHGKVKSLSNIFLKNVTARLKKQTDDFMKKTNTYIDMMLINRDLIIKHVFKNKGDTTVSCPVAFSYVINNIQGQCSITISSLVDITPLEALDMIEHCYQNLEKNYYAPPTNLFKTLFYYYLSPKDLLIVKRFNKAALTLLLDTITMDYKRAIIAPGEMVGMIAAQSIGEVSTQMSVPYETQHKIIIKNKTTQEFQVKSIIVGEFCDELILNNLDKTFNTGYHDSVETLLENLNNEYYIVGVSEDEKTSWNKISHISKHPVNGKMMKVTTRSGRIVETTTSHSHLIRKDHKVVPITGANLVTGMRIPVCASIEQNNFVKDTYENIKLDSLMGWFIGAYLSEGNLNYNEISISNISEHYIEKTKQVAALFGKECRVVEKQGAYGKSITTKFNCKELATILLNTCGNGSFVKKVPDFAFTAPIEFKAALFQGYFDGDGNFQCDDKHHEIRCCSRSQQLIKDLALILNYFSIFGNIKTEKKNDKPLYHLNISSKYAKLYQDNIGSILHSEKLSNLVEYTERNNIQFLSEQIDKINGMGEIVAYCGKILKLPGQSRTYGFWKNKDSIGRRTLEKYYKIFKVHDTTNMIVNELKIIEQAITSNVIWDEIIKIEYNTPDQTNFVYDFTVPGNQTFMTDYGVIVHNTLNSVTFETPIIVRNREGNIQKVAIGEFIEKHIATPKKLEYYKNNDTTYAEINDYYDIPSCTEDGEIVWKRIEAVTRHPVVNKDGTNTMLKITTKENREVIATKAKSFLKLINGKIIEAEGDTLKVGDYLPVSMKQIDFNETKQLNLQTVLSPTEYIYTSEVEKAKTVMDQHQWWLKHSGKTFVLPYKRSDSFVAKISKQVRNGCKTKTTLTSGCVYTKQTNICNYKIPELLDLDYNFGYLLGAYAAEGCMTKTQISIANNDIKYFKPILELCEKLNITTKIYKNENKCQQGWTSQDLRIYNTILCHILEIFCGKLSHNKFISDKIIFSNKECILGFLDAYIGGDGTINKKDKSIVMSSVSKDLLIDVQQMLNIIGVYSFITKPSKVTSNNRNTRSENIQQLYTLFVRNAQAKKLSSMLNMTLQYKQDNLQIILNNNPKYEINKNATLIPNEIDGCIVMQKKQHNYQDILFDKIIKIEEIQNTTNYAYDLTVDDTKNFNIYNGLALRDTFHFAGVASKSNVTRGVPRIEEILSLSSDIKQPTLTVFLKPEDERQKEKAQTIMYMLEHTRLEEVVKSIEVCFDPDDLNTLISEDKDTIEQFRAFENMVAECSEASLKSDDVEKSKWIIRMEMDPEIMLEKNITMDDINFTLKNCFDEQVNCIYSDFNSDKLIFRIRMNEIIKSGSNRSGAKKTSVNPLDQSDQIYILKNLQDQILKNVVLRGIKGINKVILRKIIDNMVESNGIYKKQDIWVLDTIGTNLLDVLGLDFIDNKRTMSNDIVEIFNVLGIEAARQAIYNELVEVVEFDGTYINFHNYSVLVDRMTFTQKLISIFRHGINNDNIGPIAKASFEETPEMFLKAARHAELDTLRGVSANVMCGQEGFFGTAAFQVILDIEEAQKLDAVSEYKPVNIDDEIDNFFGNIENPDDPCGINKIAIQNNVGTIEAEDMGNDNTYNPGF
jgi:DNA-directed RNA polymerase beta' subunit